MSTVPIEIGPGLETPKRLEEKGNIPGEWFKIKFDQGIWEWVGDLLGPQKDI